ncbi:MAG: hypothetical protein QOE14_2710, partial [Humisphaera sp.]|nr:hypothetical protein [Humisphaera sp.]
MKVLLDECVVQAFRHFIPGHDVFTVGYMGWLAVKNGQLLAQAVSEGFDAFVTTDRGVPYEQHVATLPIAVIILTAGTNDLSSLTPLAPQLLVSL